MGIRQAINENPRITAGATIGILVALMVAVVFMRGGGEQAAGGGIAADKVFFTTDDGKTFFTDDATKIPPWKTPDGKTAYRVQVYKCGNAEPFVAHLESYTSADKERLEK